MINKIVFDLDGTLWKTEESYLYAYKRVKEEFGLESLPEEEILSVVGIELSYVRDYIFGKYENADELTWRAVEYSTEYVWKYPCFCSLNLKRIFKELEEKYELYIISGCPRIYMEAILDCSGVKEYVKKSYTLEDGNKKDILKELSKENKIVFVGDSSQDYSSISDHTKVFFCYAKYGYFSLDTYDYAISSLDEILDLMKKIEIKERMLLNQSYEVVGYKDSSLTLIYKNSKSAYFGFLSLGELSNVKEILKRVKERKINIYGPFDGNTWYSYRLAIDSFDFALYPDCAGSKEILNLFFNEGFCIYCTYSSTLAPINKRVWEHCRKNKLPKGLQIAIYQNEECYNHIEELYKISSIAFQKADFYEPISFEDFKDIYLKNIQLAHPDILMIYDKEKAIAFNFCYEDLEKRFYVCKTIAILPEYQNKSILKLLINYSYQIMEEKGYKEVLYHFQNDRTKVLDGIFKNNFIRQKKYGVLCYENQ